MGSGSSSGKVQNINKGTQMPSVSQPRPPSSPSRLDEPVFKPISSKPKVHNHRRSAPDDEFTLDSNIEEYSSIWDPTTRLSSIFQQPSKSKIEHHQKETFNNKWNKKSSANFDSAHVESTIDTQIHSYIHLSSSEKINEYIKTLNHIHTQLDDTIKRRTEQISIETESVHSHILNETQQKQQRLLNYAKKQQLKQDEEYQNLLQEYISKLDEIKAKQLAELQNELQIHREKILEESQLKIMNVNEQANLTKEKILREEQEQASEKIHLIIGQIQKLSNDEKSQYLGSELITKTNIITNSNVGTKAPGQDFKFNFEENDLSQPPPSSKGKQRLTRQEEQTITHSTTNSSAPRRSKQQ